MGTSDNNCMKRLDFLDTAKFSYDDYAKLVKSYYEITTKKGLVLVKEKLTQVMPLSVVVLFHVRCFFQFWFVEHFGFIMCALSMVSVKVTPYRSSNAETHWITK